MQNKNNLVIDMSKATQNDLLNLSKTIMHVATHMHLYGYKIQIKKAKNKASNKKINLKP